MLHYLMMCMCIHTHTQKWIQHPLCRGSHRHEAEQIPLEQRRAQRAAPCARAPLPEAQRGVHGFTVVPRMGNLSMKNGEDHQSRWSTSPYLSLSLYIFVYLYIYAYTDMIIMYTYMYVYIYIYTYTYTIIYVYYIHIMEQTM